MGKEHFVRLFYFIHLFGELGNGCRLGGDGRRVFSFVVVFLLVVSCIFHGWFPSFFVLRLDLIVDTVSLSDSSSSWTHFLFGEAGSGAGFSAAQYKSSTLAIAFVNILSLVFLMHSSAGSQYASAALALVAGLNHFAIFPVFFCPVQISIVGTEASLLSLLSHATLPIWGLSICGISRSSAGWLSGTGQIYCWWGGINSSSLFAVTFVLAGCNDQAVWSPMFWLLLLSPPARCFGMLEGGLCFHVLLCSESCQVLEPVTSGYWVGRHVLGSVYWYTIPLTWVLLLPHLIHPRISVGLSLVIPVE